MLKHIQGDILKVKWLKKALGRVAFSYLYMLFL